MPNQPLVPFPVIGIIVMALAGFLNGCLAGRIFRCRKFWAAGAVWGGISALSAALYGWYALAYVNYGEWLLFMVYLACAWMILTLILPVPLILMWLISLAGKGHIWICGAVIFCGAAAFFTGIYGTVHGDRTESIEQVELSVENLPPAFDGFRIALLTDTHIGPYYHYADLDADLYQAYADKADMVAIGGDLINDIRMMPDTARVLTARSGLFPYGIYYVWGNHEYYRNKAYIGSELEKTPVHMLVNSHKSISRSGEKLYIAGADYPWGPKNQIHDEEEKMADQAFSGIPSGSAVVFMAHHSDFITEGMERQAFLTLTGHTHGGQTGINGRALFPIYEYMRGLYGGNGIYGYVSRGTGHWFPFRLGCSREMTIFTLHSMQRVS